MAIHCKEKEHKMEVSLDSVETVSDLNCGMNCYLYMSTTGLLN